MPEYHNPMLQAAAARLDFLYHGGQMVAGVSDLVVASWERSRTAGVDVLQPQSVFTAAIDTDSLLTRCARPVLERLAADTAGLPLTIGLADKKARVVQRLDSSSSITRLFDRVQYAPGFDFAESTMGTNGAGTVLAAGQPISVVGPEHFSEKLHMFAAGGAPIIDPVTSRVEGVLTIASLTQSWNPIIATLAKGAAKEIADNLLLDRSQAQRAIFDAFVRATARSSRRAVFAFGPALAIASTVAQQLFDPGEQQALCEHASFLLAHRDRVSDTLPLPGGRGRVDLRGTRIVVGSKVVGVLVFVEFVEPTAALRAASIDDPGRPPPPRKAGPARRTAKFSGAHARSGESLAGGRAPAWLRACEELRAALRKQQPALVVGEPGVGKFTLITELFRSVYPGPGSVALDATQLATGSDDHPPGISALLTRADAPTLHIVRDIDEASETEVAGLGAYFAAVASVDGPVWAVATVSRFSTGAELPFSALLGHFGTAITVPPLRCRTDDLPGITAALLRSIAPARTVLLSPAAQQLVSRYSWPGNITQLREALTHAVDQRPVGEIQQANLPGYCRTGSRRTLTPLEVVERDAIVTALQEVKGNRAAAAAQLGMSRSSLYRKLKTYRITV